MPLSLSSSKESSNSYSYSCKPSSPGVAQPPKAVAPSSASGPSPYNMDPANRNFSLDTLHISLDILSENSDMLRRLKEAKSDIQSNNQEEAPFNFLSNGSTHFIWSLQRTGLSKFPYVLRKGDLIFKLSARPFGSTIPNAVLQIGSISCNSDPSSILKEIVFWLSFEGLRAGLHKTSRFDICADLRVDIAKTHIQKQDRQVTRAVDFTSNYSHRKVTGVKVGSGDIQCRIYDKQAEMRRKGDLEKQMFFWKKWGVEPTDPITRVEFQVRGDAINQFFNGEKPTLDELIICMPAIWKYLTENWLRITQYSVTAARSTNTQHRVETSFFWKKVQSASFCASAVVRRAKQKIVNVVRLVKQAGGCLAGVAAAMGLDFTDKKGILETMNTFVGDWFKEKYREPGFQNLYEARQARAILL